MIEDSAGALGALEPPPTPDLGLLGVAAGLLVATALFATLRASLRQAHGARILGSIESDTRRSRIGPLLERVDSLATSAHLLTLACVLGFTVTTIHAFSPNPPGPWITAQALAVAVPLLAVMGEALPAVLARRFGDDLLARGLPAFHLVQWPVSWLAQGVEGLRRMFQRLFGISSDVRTEREIVEGLRGVIADSELDGDLDDTERELIGNVMEFGDLDVAAVMTPRTEITAVEVEDDPIAIARAITECGHSRIPIFEGNLDSIIGIVSAQDLVRRMAGGELESVSLRDIMRPVFFVPETKQIDGLLTEFKAARTKIAVVLDEYGGTAGLVTVADVLAEIVGELQDEYDPEQQSPIQKFPDGAAEVDASLHVTEVNEELDLDLPEEADFETLGGFVLAELGHFPQSGESFERGATHFRVLEANDRRVLKVRVEPIAAERSA